MYKILSIDKNLKIMYKKHETFIFFILLILIFQETFKDLLGGTGFLVTFINYADEFIALYFSIFTFKEIIIKNARKNEYLLLGIAIIILILGGVASAKNRLQFLVPTIIDAFGCVKYLLTIVGATLYFRKYSFNKRFFYSLQKIVKLVAYLYAALAAVNIFIVQIFPIQEFRFFMNAQYLFYSHAYSLAFVCVMGLIVLMYTSRQEKNLISMVLLSLVGISSLRTKEIVVIISIWLIYIYFIVGKFRSKMPIIIGGFISAILIGWDRFVGYYGNPNYARGILAMKSLDIANDYFPLGTGFGTYGTGMSMKYYSSLYFSYGMSNIHGLTPEYTNFAADVFWPAILGQLGYIGVVVFAIIMAISISRTLQIKKDRFCFGAALGVVVYIITASMSSTSITGTFGVIWGIFLSYFWTVSQSVVEE